MNTKSELIAKAKILAMTEGSEVLEHLLDNHQNIETEIMEASKLLEELAIAARNYVRNDHEGHGPDNEEIILTANQLVCNQVLLSNNLLAIQNALEPKTKRNQKMS